MSTVTFSTAAGNLLGERASSACGVLNNVRFKAAQLALNDKTDKDQNSQPGEVYVPSGTNPESAHVASGVTGRVSFDPAHPPKADDGLQQYVGGPIDKWSAELRHTFHLQQRPGVQYGESLDNVGFNPTSFDGTGWDGTRYTLKCQGDTETATESSGKSTFQVELNHATNAMTFTITEPDQA
ncbi:MAG TPA: hypothetical protein VGO93_12365 [Candidatus Xenobia bacterium]